jgi:hypothetical protein
VSSRKRVEGISVLVCSVLGRWFATTVFREGQTPRMLRNWKLIEICSEWISFVCRFPWSQAVYIGQERDQVAVHENKGKLFQWYPKE